MSASRPDKTNEKVSDAANQRARDGIIRPIATFGGARPPAPDWFEKALAAPFDEGRVTVDGADIHYLAWGPRGAPGLLFVHGGRAHARWWQPFAPFFSDRFRIAALDLSGMGDSGWREQYSLRANVKECFAVADATGLCDAGPPIVVGHSYGGWVALACVEMFGERLKGAVIVDTPIAAPNPDEDYHVEARDDKPVRPTRIYDRIEEPIARFRLLPNQPCQNPFLIDHIARHGLRRVAREDGGEGWTWKFDPAMGRNFEIHFRRDLFLAARCPLAFFYAEKSAFTTPETLDHLRQQTVGRAPIVVVPDAYHHLMMDQPIAFATALNTLFAAWPVRIGA